MEYITIFRDNKFCKRRMIVWTLIILLWERGVKLNNIFRNSNFENRGCNIKNARWIIICTVLIDIFSFICSTFCLLSYVLIKVKIYICVCLWEKHAVFDKTFISFLSPFFPSVFTRFLIPLYFNLEQKKKATRVIGLISIIYPLKIDRIKGETYLFPPFVFPFNWNGITNFPNNYSIIISPLSCFIIISSSLAVVHPSFDCTILFHFDYIRIMKRWRSFT